MFEISKVFKLITAIILLALLVACSSDEDPTIVKPTSEINIDGDWKTSCKEDQQDGTSTINSFKFSKDDFTYEKHIYSDDSCSQTIESKTRTGKITDPKKEPKITPSGKEAYERDLLFDDGEEWKSLVALEDKGATLYLSPGLDGAARPDDFIGKNVYTLKEGTVVPPPHVDIDGKWLSNCYESKEGAGFTFFFSVSKDRFSLTVNKYSDSSCTQSEEKTPNKGKITYGKKVITPSGLTAYEIDLQLDNGSTWESLVSKQGNKLVLNPDLENAGRPDDITSGIEFSKDSGAVGHVDIDGSWQTDCDYDEDDKLGYDAIFVVSGNSFSFRITRYLDNSCTQSKDSQLGSGKITYGEENISTPSGLTAHEIDLRYENGEVWESLVAKQGSKLILNPDLEGTGRPDDIDRGFLFSEQ